MCLISAEGENTQVPSEEKSSDEVPLSEEEPVVEEPEKGSEEPDSSEEPGQSSEEPAIPEQPSDEVPADTSETEHTEL